MRHQSWIDRLDGCFVLVLSGAVLVLVRGRGVPRSIAITSTSRSTVKAPSEPVNPRLTATVRTIQGRACGRFWLESRRLFSRVCRKRLRMAHSWSRLTRSRRRRRARPIEAPPPVRAFASGCGLNEPRAAACRMPAICGQGRPMAGIHEFAVARWLGKACRRRLSRGGSPRPHRLAALAVLAVLACAGFGRAQPARSPDAFLRDAELADVFFRQSSEKGDSSVSPGSGRFPECRTCAFEIGRASCRERV